MSERLNWGLIGGGEGSQIGFAHLIGAELDGKFKFAAGALDVDPQRSREYGKRLGLAEDRGLQQVLVFSHIPGCAAGPHPGLLPRI